jgi:tyrosyl-tRNA synthetase
VTSPLVTKTDGSKFGKTEKGNIYLNPELTSPYRFYQFWLNVSDADAEKFIKIFTFLTKEEIETLTKQHYEAPHQRILQQKLAEEVTTFVHSKEEHDKAVKASNILFGRSTTEDLNSLDESTLLSAMDGVPQYKVDRGRLKNGINLIDLLAVETNVLPSKNEAKKMIKGNAISVNKIKRSDIESEISEIDLINNRYILLQKGKKNYYLLSIE